jgi:putative membrane protein insertion efficiency factor
MNPAPMITLYVLGALLVLVAVTTVSSRAARVVAGALVWLLRLYQNTISVNRGPTCRFQPSCSHYAVEALQVHGVARGIVLSTWRLLRCGPWHPGGADPVPPARGARARSATPCTAEDHFEEQAPC